MPADAAALADIVAIHIRAFPGFFLIQRPDRADDLGRRARVTFQEHYTLHRMVSAYRQLYLQLLES
jgi:hypothetical protein